MHPMKRFAAVLALGVCWMMNPSPAHADVNAKRALNTVLPATNLDNVSLNDAIDFLRDVSGANLHVNWRALEGVGVGKDAQVNVRLRSTPLRKVLDLVLNEAGAGTALTYYVDQGVIEVTTRELADKDQFTRVYPVEDLIVEVPDFVGPDINITAQNSNQSRTAGSGGGGGGGSSGSMFSGSGGSGTNGGDEKMMTRTERAQALIDVITNAIQPDIWQVNGGSA